jgi:3-hydroxyacyl-CoA dehydrogenase/enoyl-CoA hydratase/3-hydroxybutyryl-CoA epimerase
VGFTKAIELITASKRLKGDKALKLGLVDASVPRGYLGFKKEEFVEEILAGTLQERIAKQRKGIKWYEMLAPVKKLITCLARREIVKKTGGHYPAPLKALDVLEETLTMSVEEGSKVELDVFVPLATSEVSKNLITLFFTSEKLKKENFSKGEAKPIENVVVVGVGTMGSGIAWALAAKDIPVRLKARKMSSIAKAMAKMMQNFEAIKRRGRLNSREIGLKMDAVTHTTGVEGLSTMDMAIEAVSEERAIKEKVFEELETFMPKDAIIATNTSSLAITALTKKSKHPERFVGMHFFNPVAKMPLVEVIAGEKTSEDSIATVVQLAKKLGKTPIKVGECAGFLVNRILLPYLNESAKMFEEGESIERIDKILTDFGMPMGPFTLADEVGIDIGETVSSILYEAYGERMMPSPLLEQMSAKAWLGKKTGSGFYTHKGKKRSPNRELEMLRSSSIALEKNIILDRAMLIMVNEASRCLAEDVVDTAQYLDMAMVMGTGFPAFRGGLLRYADTLGIKEVVDRLNDLNETFGERFAPAKLLVEMAQKDQTFYGGV